MRPHPSERLEFNRLREGHLASETGDLHGAFMLKGPEGTPLKILSSGTGPEAEGWEHVSVSCPDRTPTWAEMCFVKSLFWREEECVMQLHPPESDYRSHHPYCLHMWRPLDAAIPMPPGFMVAPKVTGSKP